MGKDTFEPYRKTYEFIRSDLTRFGYLGVMNLLIMYASTMIAQIFSYIVSFLIFIPIIMIVLGIFMLTAGPIGIIAGILTLLIGGLLLIAILALMMGIIVAVWVIAGGLNIFISEKLHEMGDGKKIKFEGLLREAYDRRKDLARKGARLILAYLAVSFPVVLTMSLISGGLMMAILIGTPMIITDPSVGAPTILILILLLSLLSILLYPFFFVLMFVYDMTAIRLTEGLGTKAALRMSLKNVLNSKRGVGLYCLGVLGMILIMNLVFPLAFLGQGFMVVITKSFIIANRRMFRNVQ